MTIEARPIIEIEGIDGTDIESTYQREVRVTAANYLRSAALIIPDVKSAIESAKTSNAITSEDFMPSVHSVKKFYEAQSPHGVQWALRSLVGREGLVDLIPRWTKSFDTIVNNGMGDDYINVLENADPESVPLFIDATSMARSYLNNLNQELEKASFPK